MSRLHLMLGPTPARAPREMRIAMLKEIADIARDARPRTDSETVVMLSGLIEAMANLVLQELEEG